MLFLNLMRALAWLLVINIVLAVYIGTYHNVPAVVATFVFSYCLVMTGYDLLREQLLGKNDNES